MEWTADLKEATILKRIPNSNMYDTSYFRHAQLNYIYRMKSRTEYVWPESLGRIKKENGVFKRFKAMVDVLISLELRISTLKSELEKGRR